MRLARDENYILKEQMIDYFPKMVKQQVVLKWLHRPRPADGFCSILTREMVAETKGPQ
jgi:hypothetical protein